MEHYEVDSDRMGEKTEMLLSHSPQKFRDSLYVRDYERCILCYKCVEACGEDAQHTFAIATAGRGFDAHISTEFDVALPDSALRLLWELHRRLPNRSPCFQNRTRYAKQNLERTRSRSHDDCLFILWGWVQLGTTRSRRKNSKSYISS